MHQRQLIRQTVRKALLDKTDAEDRVHATRVLPYRRQDLTVIAVYTLEESVAEDSLTTAPRELERNVTLVIEGWVTPGECVDDKMDSLAEQIETAMHCDPYFGGVVAESILDSTVTEYVVESDRESGLVILTYDVKYYSDAPIAPVLDDFNTANIRHNLGNDVDPGDEASDLITVQGP